jgi:hypothetical protein
VPSPNLSPGGPGGFALAGEVMRDARRAHREGELPDKIARKYEKISRKIEKKMAALLKIRSPIRKRSKATRRPLV